VWERWSGLGVSRCGMILFFLLEVFCAGG
jgi:hypothetical protein